MGDLWRRLVYLLRRRQLERELADEMEAHREMMGAERSRMFGSTLRLREESNDAWGFGWWDRLWQDIRYGVRAFRRSPGFTLTAIAVLAFGIGVNLTAFEILNFFVLRPLPVRDPHNIVRLSRAAPGSSSNTTSYGAYEFYRQHSIAVTSLMARVHEEVTLESGDRLRARFVTRNYLEELGARPAYGRLLRQDVHEPGAVVLSYQCFERKFGGDSSWIGRTIRLNRQTSTIVGVTPAGFTGLSRDKVDMWAAIDDHPMYFAGSTFLRSHEVQPVHLYGRLATGVSLHAAEEALRPLAAELKQQYPSAYWDGEWVSVVPGGNAERLDTEAVPAIALAGALVLLVLITACANLGNLLLARGAARERELSIRSAAGASRARLVRQLLTESLMLAFLGAAAGLAVSTTVLQILIRLFDPGVLFDISPDWRILSFAAGAALLSVLLFGLAPALQATRRRSVQQAARLRTVLVAVQVAASCALVILSGLLVRGLRTGLQTDPGFTFMESVTIDPNLYSVGRKGEAAKAYLDAMQANLSRIPGVASASLATLSPFGGRSSMLMHEAGKIAYNRVEGNYFQTLEIPLLSGRTFRSSDGDNVCIVSERLAKKLWPEEDAIGKVFYTQGRKQSWIVVAVARNAPVTQFGEMDAMEIYRPIQRLEDAFVIVRTTNLNAAGNAIRQAADAVDPKVLPRITPVRESFELRMRDRKLAATSISMLGFTAMLLAVVGLSGLISFTVAQRTREIGVRMALGASRMHAMRVGVERLARPVATGVLLGALGAWGLGTILRSMLFGLSPVDPASYFLAVLVFGVFAALSSTGPLLRAARVDPAVALRHD